MNFRPELAEAVMAGRKTVTRRAVSDNPRSPWHRDSTRWPAGKVFAVCPGRSKPNIGHARVVSAFRLRLGPIGDDEARREGFDNADAFEAAWAAINGGYDPATWVWRIEFEVVT